MIRIEDKSRCTGCGACKDSCSMGAIALVADEEGFLYPRVDANLCVKCGKCLKVCPINRRLSIPEDKNAPTAYAAQTHDEAVRLASSSGGVFTELATHILRQGGVVFGAALNEDMHLFHIAIEDEEELKRLQGSKYVQSCIGSTYKECREYLRSGRPVLFTGTPCQIGGLYRFLGREYETLVTQDIVCHGVPAPSVWERYLAWREQIAGAKTGNVSFRNKKYGWKSYSLIFQFSNGKEYCCRSYDDLYMRGFLKDLCLRPACYSCAFKTRNRVADITLADFWRVETICPEMDDDKGTSLVILHSEKGRDLFEAVKKNLRWKEVSYDEAIQYNAAMTHTASPNSQRADFIRVVINHGFPFAAQKFLKLPPMLRIKKCVKALIRKVVKR